MEAGAARPKNAEETLPGAARPKNAEETLPGAPRPKNAEETLNNERTLNAINKSGFTPLDILVQTDRNGFKLLDFLEETGRSKQIELTLRAAGCLEANELIDQAEWLSKKRESLMVVASLIATMTFQATLNPPGGYWQDNKKEHKAGENVMAFNWPTMYSLFLFANSMGFFGSIMTILLLVTGLPFKNRLNTWLLVLVMFLTVVSTVVAYTLTILVTTSKKDRQPLTDCVVIVGWTWCLIMMALFLGHLIWFIYGWLFTKIKTRNARRNARMEAEKKQGEIIRELTMDITST